MKRRNFIKATATVSAFSIIKPNLVFGTKVNSAVRFGIIGCGNRGTAVISSMSENANVNIVAMADLFTDKLQTGEVNFNKLNAGRNFAAIKKNKHIQRLQSISAFAGKQRSGCSAYLLSCL